MRKYLVLLLILTTFLSICATTPHSEVFEGRITPANNRDYQHLILPLLKSAKKSVHIVMFQASYYTDPRYIKTSPTNLFIRELIEVKKRGVKVEVILNQSNSDYESYSAGENLKTGAYLANNGIMVYLDTPEKNTHAKFLVIDERFVVIGSANWTYSAMTTNNEASVIIDSPKLAQFYINYFEDIKKECRPFLTPLPSPPLEKK